MWVPKYLKDRSMGRFLPLPTQIVSNEEYLPVPQSRNQRRVEKRINELASHYSKRLGQPRREFLTTSGGMAAAFIAMNEVFGHYFAVTPAEAAETAAYDERWPKNQFIFDVQTHHVRAGAPEPLFFRKLSAAFNKELEGVEPQRGDLQIKNYTKEVFFDSDTVISLISGVPSRLLDVLSADDMVSTRNQVNALAGSQRMLSHGFFAPYLPNLMEELERQAKELKIDAWKCYTGVPKYENEYPWTMDDEETAYPFYEKTRELGIQNICVHKGLPLPGSSPEFTHPRDIKKAALDHPDLNFIIYHAGFKAANYELKSEDEYIGQDGYLAWTTDLVRAREENPRMTNVYMELGTTFGHTVVTHPKICAHLLGQVIRAFGADHVIWGTDSIWWGSPQWQIEAMRRFQIPEVLQEEFGYAPITDEDKAKIFGLNAARLFNVDVNIVRNAVPFDGLSKLKAQYQNEGGKPSNTQYGWIKDAKSVG